MKWERYLSALINFDGKDYSSVDEMLHVDEIPFAAASSNATDANTASQKSVDKAKPQLSLRGAVLSERSESKDCDEAMTVPIKTLTRQMHKVCICLFVI